MASALDRTTLPVHPMDLTEEDCTLILDALRKYPDKDHAQFLIDLFTGSAVFDEEADRRVEDYKHRRNELQRQTILPMAKIAIIQQALRKVGTYHRCEGEHVR